MNDQRCAVASTDASLLHVHRWTQMQPYMLVAWYNGRTSVFGRRTFPVLCSTCSWWVTIYVGKPSAIRQLTRPAHPLGVSKWELSWNWISATSVRGGAIWWTLTKERQARCNLQVKLIHVWALKTMRCINGTI